MSLTPNSRKRKGQVALEFALFVMVSFLFLTIFLYAIKTRLVELNAEKDAKEIRDLTNRVREEIFLASIVQDGYSRGFILPTQLNNRDYTLTIDAPGEHIIGQLGNISYTTPIPAILGSGPAIGHNNITKTGGAIYLN